jgi:hypothetical protein
MQREYSHVRGHSNKKKWNSFAELKDLNLSREETNVWCDHMADAEWSSGILLISTLSCLVLKNG